MDEFEWDDIPQWHFAIAGIQTNVEELEVLSGITIRRLRKFPTRKIMSDSLDNDLVIGLMQHYAGNHVIEHELVIESELLDDPIPANELALNVIAGLRIQTETELFCPAACDCSWMALESADHHPCVAAVVETAMYSHTIESPKAITDDDVDWLSEHLTSISDLSLEDRFAIGFNALTTYKHAADLRMMATQLWGGIEALVGAKYLGSYGLSLWAALYLQPRGIECKTLRHAIRKLYDKRSDVVHGRSIKDDDLQKHVVEARRILGQLLAKVIEAGELPSDEHFHELTTMP